MTPHDTGVRCANLNSVYYIEDGEAPDVSIWHKLSRLLKVLLLLTTVGMIIGAFLPELRTQRNERAKQAQLQEQINAQRRLHTRYERELNWLNNDREYIEAIARDKFDLMRDGETIFRMDGSKPALAPVLPIAPKRLK